MNSYRRVVTAVTLIAALMVGALPFLSTAQAATLTVGILIVSAAVDILSTAYIGRLVWTDKAKPKSWLLLLMLTTSVYTTIGVSLVVSVLFFPPGTLPPGLGRLLIGMGIVAVGAAPPIKAGVFLLIRGDPSVARPTIEAILPGAEH